MTEVVNAGSDNLNDILERCIQAIENGQASVEECVARFPDYPELGSLLQVAVAFREMPRPEMPAAFAAKTQQRLQAQLRQRIRVSRPARPRLGWLPRLAIAVLVIVLIVGAGGTAVVRAAANTTPYDGILYKIKRLGEGFQQALPGANQTDVQYNIAHERVREIGLMAARSQPVTTEFLKEMQSDVAVALESKRDDNDARNRLITDTSNALVQGQAVISTQAMKDTTAWLEGAKTIYAPNVQNVTNTPTASAVVEQHSATPTASSIPKTSTVTPTATTKATSTNTFTFTATSSPMPKKATSQPTQAATSTATRTPSRTPTPITPTATQTPSATFTMGPGGARVLTGIPTDVPSVVTQPGITPAMITPSPLPATVPATSEATQTSAATETTGTQEATNVATERPTDTATSTEMPSATPTEMPTDTPTNTATFTRTPTKTPTFTPTKRPTRTPLPTKTFTPTPLPTVPPTATPVPSATPSGLPGADLKQSPQEITFHDCQPQGDGSDATLNQIKNRVDEGRYAQVTFDAIGNLPWPKDAEGKPRDQWQQGTRDQVAWAEGFPVTVEGNLVRVQENPPEAQNCHSNDFKTWQLYFVSAPGGDPARVLVAGIGPRIRTNHAGWTLEKLNALAGSGARIRVSGWLMLNQEHPEEIGRTRISLWEIHPAMQITIAQNDQWINLDDYHP